MISRLTAYSFIIVLLLWVASFFSLSYMTARGAILLEPGALRSFHYSRPIGAGSMGLSISNFSPQLPIWKPDYSTSPWGDWSMTVPVWMFLLLPGGGMVYDFLRGRRSHRPGKVLCCSHCGYDLSGHVEEKTVRCPECGKHFRPILSDPD